MLGHIGRFGRHAIGRVVQLHCGAPLLSGLLGRPLGRTRSGQLVVVVIVGSLCNRPRPLEHQLLLHAPPGAAPDALAHVWLARVLDRTTTSERAASSVR